MTNIIFLNDEDSMMAWVPIVTLLKKKRSDYGQTPECTIAELSKLFVESNFHALPVVNEQGEVVGIVTTTDVIAYFMGKFQ